MTILFIVILHLYQLYHNKNIIFGKDNSHYNSAKTLRKLLDIIPIPSFS